MDIPYTSTLLLQVPCKDNPDEFCLLNDDDVFGVAVPSFLSNGGSKTLGFPDHSTDLVTGPTSDYEAFKAFVKANSPIKTEVEGRLIINYHPGEKNVAGGIEGSMLYCLFFALAALCGHK